MEREYIKVKRPTSLPVKTNLLRELTDDVWLNLIFFHLLNFYKNYDITELKNKINAESLKEHSRIEKLIAKYIRKYLRNNRDFDLVLDVNGESESDTDVEGYYDLKISNTYWNDKKYFPIECKNLGSKKNLINEYVFVKNKSKTDGGIYRYFNGKYAQNQNFGGMMGFILEGNTDDILLKIVQKIGENLDTSPVGDLKEIARNSIQGNDFTFTSMHNNQPKEDFKIYHFLLQFS